MTGPVLFCFDGSEGSMNALSDGGQLLSHRVGVVLTVWEALATELATSPGAAYAYVAAEDETDSHDETAARRAAEQGARMAAEHGWEASVRVERASVSVWRTIVDVADELDASVIVCGERGRNRLKRAVLGSVAEAVLRHSRRPTLITRERRVE